MSKAIDDFPEEMKRNFMAGLMDDPKYNQLRYQSIILNMQDKIERLEKKVFKNTKKLVATRAQQVLMLYHLGLLEKLDELNISQVKKGLLLSILLDSSMENIKDDLTEIHKPKSKLKTTFNYEFLVQVFDSVGLDKHANEVDVILSKIQNSKDNQK